MNAFLSSSVIFLLFCLYGYTKDEEELLVVVRQDPKYSDAGKLTNVVIEFLASPQDVEESKKWHPYSDEILAPMTTIIEVAYENLKVPEGRLVYVMPTKYVQETKLFDPFSPLPDFRGADLRRMNEDLWYWEVYFGLSPDPSIESQASIRDGGLILSGTALPNGGKIVTKERKMTPQERILYGFDIAPDALDIFKPSEPN